MLRRPDAGQTVPASQMAGPGRFFRRPGSAAAPIAGLAIILIAMLSLVACGDDEAGSDPSSQGAQQPSPMARSQQATATATVRASPTTVRVQATRTPGRTPTPIPTPAPAIGDTIESDDYRITVTGFDLFQRVGASTAEGVFLYVRMTIENTANQPQPFPFEGLVVVDNQGRTFFLHEPATRETLTFDFGVEMDAPLPPGEERQVAAVFDIPPDATGLILTTPSRVFEIRLEFMDPTK